MLVDVCGWNYTPWAWGLMEYGGGGRVLLWGSVVARTVCASNNTSIMHCLHIFTLGAWMSPSFMRVCVKHHKPLGAHKYVVNYTYVTYLTCQWLEFYLLGNNIRRSGSDNCDGFKAITNVPMSQISQAMQLYDSSRAYNLIQSENFKLLFCHL